MVDLSGEGESRFSNKSKFLLTPPVLLLWLDTEETEEAVEEPLMAVLALASRGKRDVEEVVVIVAAVAVLVVVVMIGSEFWRLLRRTCRKSFSLSERSDSVLLW